MREGFDCKLVLSYVGYPQPEVTWLFNGRELANSDSHRMSASDNEVRLVVWETKPDQSGEYACRLRNKFGTTEVAAKVTVGVRPELIGRPNQLDVTVGNQATFECSYKGFPVPDVSWYHNKLPLTVSDRFTRLFSYLLFIM